MQGGPDDRGTPPLPDGRPEPGYRLLTGAGFRYRVVDWNHARLPFYTLQNGAECYTEKDLRLEATRATVQVYSNGTVLLQCSPFRVGLSLIKNTTELNRLLDRLAWDAWARVAKRLNIRLDYTYSPVADRKADGASIPLMTGEIVKPLPGYESIPGRKVINGATEINASPPGLSVETADLAYAAADAALPDRLLSVERALVQFAKERDTLISLMEKQNAYLEVLGHNIERLNGILGGLESKGPAGPGPEVR